MNSDLDYATTNDGWRIALHRYAAQGARRRHAVICCHGLGANRVGFDVTPDVSLARHLAAQGYEVFALELRGHGASDRPSRGSGRSFGWAFDDYLFRDVPAAIAHVARLSGRDAVHWIGHSMGGLLLYAHLASGGSAAIRSGIAVGSSLDYSATASGFHRLMILRNLVNRLPAIPVGLIARTFGAFAGRVVTPVRALQCLAFQRRLCALGPHLEHRFSLGLHAGHVSARFGDGAQRSAIAGRPRSLSESPRRRDGASAGDRRRSPTRSARPTRRAER